MRCLEPHPLRYDALYSDFERSLEIDMPDPKLSAHFESRQPSDIRLAQMAFASRTDGTRAINVAIGNVSLPMHPAMRARLRELGTPGGAFGDGVVAYTATVGTEETRRAFSNVIAASGLPTEGLHVQITDGGSQAMELVIAGVCGPAGSLERPLLLIDAAYTNYMAFAERLGRETVSVTRTLEPSGRFTLPSMDVIESVMRARRPGGLLVIPYDNPTGQFYPRTSLIALAKLAVAHDLWLISDEAYRELVYTGDEASSIWGISEEDVPGITGRRISVETASKVWNACGLRIGALVTDSHRFHTKAVAENTASLCPNAIGQHVFAALGDVSHDELRTWFTAQRAYYEAMLTSFTAELCGRIPGVIVSRPDASLYSVVDVREIAKAGFDAQAFVLWCAREGAVDLDGVPHTLLVAPMAGFYDAPDALSNPGRTQMRIAYVERPESMARVPALFAELLRAYEARR